MTTQASLHVCVSVYIYVCVRVFAILWVGVFELGNFNNGSSCARPSWSDLEANAPLKLQVFVPENAEKNSSSSSNSNRSLPGTKKLKERGGESAGLGKGGWRVTWTGVRAWAKPEPGQANCNAYLICIYGRDGWREGGGGREREEGREGARKSIVIRVLAGSVNKCFPSCQQQQ